jgi:hypothetical protein
MRRLPLLLLLVPLVWPGAAGAGWRIDRARQIADRVWNHPCNGHIQWHWEALPDQPEIAAYTRQNACEYGLTINTAHSFLGFEDLCSVVLHEVGHLAGYQDPTNPGDPWHSTNPHSVMHQHGAITYGGDKDHPTWTGVDRRCLNRGRTYLKLDTWARHTTLRSNRPQRYPRSGHSPKSKS